MIIVEYRIPMPFSAAEYRIGQLYTIAKKSKLESADSKNGVKINVNEPYSNGPGGSGQYTNKTYYLSSRIPEWMKRILPESAAKLKEEAWNAYPYSKNKFTNPLLDRLALEIESRYIDGPPTMANVFNLDKEDESARSIVVIDFVRDKYKSNCSRGQAAVGEEKPQLSAAEKVDMEITAFDPLFREPLTRDWLQEYELMASSSREDVDLVQHDNSNDTISNNGGELRRRLMTCYKLCRVHFPVWPLQTRVERFIQQHCRDTILESHKQAWLWQDEWTGMSMDQIRLMERETESQLSKMMQQKFL